MRVALQRQYLLVGRARRGSRPVMRVREHGLANPRSPPNGTKAGWRAHTLSPTFKRSTIQPCRLPDAQESAILPHMIVTITGYKGGIGKTTTAVHLAAVLQQQAPTVLVDGDLNRSATGWARNGFLPFRVADERQAAKVGREFEHIVIDTAARPIREDLEALVTGCDHLIIPTSPDALALDALIQTLGALDALGATNYRILLTIVPPAPSRDGYEARSSLEARDVPVFKTAIPRLAAFTKAALAGVVVSDVKGDSRVQRAWEAYANLGKELRSR